MSDNTRKNQNQGGRPDVDLPEHLLDQLKDAMNDNLQKLLNVVSDQEKAELAILNNAVVTNARIYREDSTAANKRNWDAAKAGFNDLIKNLSLKYFNHHSEKKFKNRLAAMEELNARGYKVHKSKIYKDAAAGILQVEKDGSVTAAALEKYIAHPESGITRHQETVAAGRDLELKDMSKDLVFNKLKREKLHAEKLELELEQARGQVIPRADFELEMVARASVLDQGWSSEVDVHAADWIHLVGGKPDRVGDLVAAIKEAWHRMLNQYVSRQTYHVMEDN